MTKELPSIEELRKVFRADFETGKLYRIQADGSGREVKGSDNGRGYLIVVFNNRNIRKHRLIFALATGRWPRGEIDHINHDKTDNRLSNLREVSPRDNCRNMPMNTRNKSGCSGVYYQTSSGRWLVKIGRYGTDTYEYLGLYEHLDDAIAARKAAEVRHGYHPNHGERRCEAL